MLIGGAGRPETTYLLERLVDVIAHDTGLDRVGDPPQKFHRGRCLSRIKPPVALAYDSGDYVKTLDEAMRVADWAGFPTRRAGGGAKG